MSFPSLRKLVAAVCGVVVVVLGNPALASAAPKNYCADLKGVVAGNVCQIQMTDPGYTVNISFPADFPDMKSVADFVGKTRDSFLNTAKSSQPRNAPYALEITPTTYTSLVPPRGQVSVVLKVYQNTGGAHPQTSYKSFVWDQTFRKLVTYETLWQKDSDPLPIVFPVVQSDLLKQLGQPVAIDPAVGLDPANYQNFAITNEGVIAVGDRPAAGLIRYSSANNRFSDSAMVGWVKTVSRTCG
jgi:hypothetical protein